MYKNQNVTQGYTKHYYAGTERIASKIGGGGIANITTPIVSTDYKRNSWTQPYANLWSSCLNLAAPCSTFFYSLLNAQTATSPETALYFYHSDHLGSASWITDSSGRAIQHLQYLPFGERFVDQRTTNWNTRYTFSAKEKDEESEYSYFGARYYDSELSIWLSVDPMSDKYPSTSAYAYCNNQPLRLIDPNGMEWEKASDVETATKLKEQATAQIETKKTQLANTTNKSKIDQLNKEIGYLEEGIKGLDAMGSESQVYRFNLSETTEDKGGNVSKGSDGIISINVSATKDKLLGGAWHESTHIMRSKVNPGLWGWNDNKLGVSEEFSWAEESYSYNSQLSFDPKSMPRFAGNSAVNSSSDIREYIKWNYPKTNDAHKKFILPERRK